MYDEALTDAAVVEGNLVFLQSCSSEGYQASSGWPTVVDLMIRPLLVLFRPTSMSEVFFTRVSIWEGTDGP